MKRTTALRTATIGLAGMLAGGLSSMLGLLVLGKLVHVELLSGLRSSSSGLFGRH